MTSQRKYFSVDPYPYKHAKENRSKEDLEFLQKLFKKTGIEIKQASKSYRDNSDGLRSFIFIAHNYENLRNTELSSKATSLAAAIIIFAIEGIMSHVKRRKNSNMSVNERRVIEYFRNCVSRENKLILLNSLAFSSKAIKSIPIGKSTIRHLMYRSMLKSHTDYERKYLKTDWCFPEESTGNINCNCINWLSSQKDSSVNYYLKLLTSHLYKMRCAIVHDGRAPLISHAEEKPPNYAVWSMTVSDIYTNNKYSRHYQYNSALSRKKLEEIFILSLWEAFKCGYPKKRSESK